MATSAESHLFSLFSQNQQLLKATHNPLYIIIYALLPRLPGFIQYHESSICGTLNLAKNLKSECFYSSPSPQRKTLSCETEALLHVW